MLDAPLEAAAFWLLPASLCCAAPAADWVGLETNVCDGLEPPAAARRW